MKIAVASEGKDVSLHFGHCEGFRIFSVAEGQVAEEKFLANPGHKPGFLPRFLADEGVDIIISGGMGQSAIDIFCSNGIEAITGAAGEAKMAVEAFLAGTLISTTAACNQHARRGGCGGH